LLFRFAVAWQVCKSLFNKFYDEIAKKSALSRKEVIKKATPAVSYANAHSKITEVMLKLYIHKGEDYEQSICS
jgi:hypothetical protein